MGNKCYYSIFGKYVRLGSSTDGSEHCIILMTFLLNYVQGHCKVCRLVYSESLHDKKMF